MRSWLLMLVCKTFALNCAYWANEPKPLGLDVPNGTGLLRAAFLMIGVALWSINEQLQTKKSK